MPTVITLTYLYNSGFSLDFPDRFLVVDYIQGPLPLPKDKPITFIVTHAHSDHYNPRIFTTKGAENATFVLSTDVEESSSDGKFIQLSSTVEETRRKKIIYDPSRTLRLEPGDSQSFQDIHWTAFGSTDQGISILFELGGISFFHAGDLNAWKWPDWPEEDQDREVSDFMEILDDLENFPVDILFAPLDPRLEGNAFLGPMAMIQRLKPQMFIPMHFREKMDITQFFRDHYQTQTKTFLTEITGKGQQIRIRS